MLAGGGGGAGGHETDSKIHPISTGKSHPPPEAESPWYIAGGMCVPKKTNLGETGLWIDQVQGQPGQLGEPHLKIKMQKGYSSSKATCCLCSLKKTVVQSLVLKREEKKIYEQDTYSNIFKNTGKKNPIYLMTITERQQSS